MTETKSIIFDLGGVLLDIDYQKSIDAFENLGVRNFKEMFSQFKADELFERLETGQIAEPDFFKAVKLRTPVNISEAEIKHAWNALLLEFRTESLAFLQQLAGSYQLYLLSNTNAIHLECFREIFTRQTGKPALDRYFKKAWYSNEVGLRKPNRDIFEFVLADENLVAAETLFIDDTPVNVETARSMGFKTHCLLPSESIEKLNMAAL